MCVTIAMKTIQLTIDEPLLAEVDEATERLHTTRSAFIRDAVKLALSRYRIEALEQRHIRGYTDHPVQPGEFDIWVPEQVWEDTDAAG
jgi:metal-responsive CopG/Arc/MetJ family transcriptional regulator